ncbi:MAG: hypothetical protein ACREM3_20080 [Candidatus Rokuibacteriota bacterium]
MRTWLIGAVAGGVLMSAAGLAGAEPDVRVAYSPSKISVEAKNVSLADLLRAIGKRAGFRVVDNGPERPPVSVTMGAGTLDELLRRLLRHEGHVILYRASPTGPRVETVLLRGPNGVAGPPPPSVVTPASPPAAASGPRHSSVVPPVPPAVAASGHRAGASTGPVPAPAGIGAAGQPAVPAPPQETSQPARAGGPQAPTVSHLLETQALAAHGVSSAPAATTPPPADVNEALGQATRTAVQGVQTLVDQLSVATEQLGASGAIPRR